MRTDILTYYLSKLWVMRVHKNLRRHGEHEQPRKDDNTPDVKRQYSRQQGNDATKVLGFYKKYSIVRQYSSKT